MTSQELIDLIREKLESLEEPQHPGCGVAQPIDPDSRTKVLRVDDHTGCRFRVTVQEVPRDRR